MSESEKTIQEQCYGICWGAQQRIDELTQQLNTANERIKRLEEAGNNLLWNFCPEYTSDFTESQSDALKQWNKAKEAKP